MLKTLEAIQLFALVKKLITFLDNYKITFNKVIRFGKKVIYISTNILKPTYQIH